MLKRRASATPSVQLPDAGRPPNKIHQTRSIMDPARAAQLASNVLPKWIGPFGAIIEACVDFTDTRDAIITLKNGTRHEVSSYSDGLQVCRKEMKRLAFEKSKADPSLQRKIDAIAELLPTDKVRLTIDRSDKLTPALNGTLIASLGTVTEALIRTWDFTSVYLMSRTPGRYALLDNGQVRQTLKSRLSKIPVITSAEKVNVLQWLHRGVVNRLSNVKAGDKAICTFTLLGGKQIGLRGGWALTSIQAACKKEWHYILMKDGNLRQAPSANVEKLPLVEPREPTLRFLSRFTINAFSVEDDGTVVFTMDGTQQRTRVKDLHYQDILTMCTRCGDGAYVLTQDGYVRRTR